MCNRFGPALAGPGRELLNERQLAFDLDEIARVRREGPLLPHGWVPAITHAENGLRLGAYHWWLIPSWWKKSIKELPSTFNAKAESVTSKPMFRGAWAGRKRCLIPAEYYLEGRKPAVTRVTRADGAPLTIAGLWDEWRSPEGEPMRSCTVLTCDANSALASIHSRMPVILGPDDWDEWLDPDTPPDQAQHLLRACPDEWLVTQLVQ